MFIKVFRKLYVFTAHTNVYMCKCVYTYSMYKICRWSCICVLKLAYNKAYILSTIMKTTRWWPGDLDSATTTKAALQGGTEMFSKT